MTYVADEGVDEEELDDYFRRMRIASEETEKAPTVPARATPCENVLSTVGYEEPPKGTEPNKVKAIMSRLHSMTTSEMKDALKEIHHSPYGTKRQLREKLRRFYRTEYANVRTREGFSRMRNKTETHFEYLVVMDVECTCERVLDMYPHEIIELPAVLIDVRAKKIVDQFRTYVRPTLRPNLDPFCVELTNITQSMVDSAPLFPEALSLIRLWMDKHRLGAPNARFAFVTDGPHDLWRFFQFQCEVSGIEKPPHDFRYFINIKKTFETVNSCRLNEMNLEKSTTGRRVTGIDKMLHYYNMQFEGLPHSGLDDSINIARLAIMMIEKGIELKINQRITKTVTAKEKKDDEDRLSRVRDNEEKDRLKWTIRLPYRLKPVSKDDFISGAYLDCDTCDEL